MRRIAVTGRCGQRNVRLVLPWALLLIAALSGCATQVATLNVAGLEKSAQAQVQDLRPPTEKQGETFSLMITNDAYAISRVAEDLSTPTPMRLLQHRAFESLPGQNVKVMHLVVYRNAQTELRRRAIGAGLGGIIGALVAGNTVTSIQGATSSLADQMAFEALAKDEFKRALYSEAENSGRGSVLVIYVDTDVGGKRVITRTLAPLVAKEAENAYLNALEASFKYQLDQYIPGRDAASKTSADTAVAATVSAASLALWTPGTQLFYVDSDARSRAAMSESSFVVTEISSTRRVLNDGQIVSDSDGTPQKGAMHSALIFGAGPAQIARGGRWTGMFRVSGGYDDAPVQLTLLSKQSWELSGRRFTAARIKVEGYASRSYAVGINAAVGAAIEGEMLVDADTGLVLEMTVNSRHPGYALRRELVRIGSN